MRIIESVNEARNQIKQWKLEGLKIGLIPTMGYLHEGHKSLIERAKHENDKVVVTVFVNPTQFGPNEDLDKYPRNIKRDTELCEEVGVDFIFAPTSNEMYLKEFCSYVNVEGLSNELCGVTRPTHFRGVCTVLTKLFNIIPADRGYFGQKDAQQVAIIKKMVEDLNFDIEIIECPIIREQDGLAKSSRNSYLSTSEREAALILNKSLKIAKNAIENGEVDAKKIIEIISNNIKTEKLAKIDYVKVVDLKSIQVIDEIKNSVLVAIAVYIGKTRLIDNFILKDVEGLK